MEGSMRDVFLKLIVVTVAFTVGENRCFALLSLLLCLSGSSLGDSTALGNNPLSGSRRFEITRFEILLHGRSVLFRKSLLWSFLRDSRWCGDIPGNSSGSLVQLVRGTRVRLHFI